MRICQTDMWLFDSYVRIEYEYYSSIRSSYFHKMFTETTDFEVNEKPRGLLASWHIAPQMCRFHENKNHTDKLLVRFVLTILNLLEPRRFIANNTSLLDCQPILRPACHNQSFGIHIHSDTRDCDLRVIKHSSRAQLSGYLVPGYRTWWGSLCRYWEVWHVNQHRFVLLDRDVRKTLSTVLNTVLHTVSPKQIYTDVVDVDGFTFL